MRGARYQASHVERCELLLRRLVGAVVASVVVHKMLDHPIDVTWGNGSTDKEKDREPYSLIAAVNTCTVCQRYLRDARAPGRKSQPQCSPASGIPTQTAWSILPSPRAGHL